MKNCIETIRTKFRQPLSANVRDIKSGRLFSGFKSFTNGCLQKRGFKETIILSVLRRSKYHPMSIILRGRCFLKFWLSRTTKLIDAESSFISRAHTDAQLFLRHADLVVFLALLFYFFVSPASLYTVFCTHFLQFRRLYFRFCFASQQQVVTKQHNFRVQLSVR